MGLMDLFKRSKVADGNVGETRALATGYTTEIMAARESWIMGRAGVADLTATVQACVSLWEAGFALADVKGAPMLDRRSMAILARALALRGEGVFLIGDRLIPAVDWEVKTRDGIPTAYRLGLSDTGGGRRVTALAPEVLHVRIGSDGVAPWAGTAPLRRASLSAELLQAVEAALRDVYRDAPIGSVIVPLPDSTSEDMAAMRRALVGRRGAAVVIEGTAQATAAGMNPQLEKRVEQIGPDLSRAMTAETLAAARGAILMAFGVLPGLVNPATTGPLVREAQRHLAQLVLQPMAMILAEEAAEKLGNPVSVDVVRPMQAFDHGGKARALATMVAALAEAKAAGLDGAALHDAMTFIDWQE